MNKEHLFEEESFIAESEDKTIILTTHRIRYDLLSSGRGHLISISLEKISSIEVKYTSWIAMLIIGIFFIVGGLIMSYQNQEEVMISAIIIGSFCVLLFFLTRKHVITISSDGGGKINFQTKGMKRETLLEFIKKIEKAKAARYKYT